MPEVLAPVPEIPERVRHPFGRILRSRPVQYGVGLPATAATMWVLGAGPAHASPDLDSSTITVSSTGPDTHTGIYLGEGHTVFVEVVGGKWNMNAKDPNSPWAGPVGYAPNAPGREACRQIPGDNFAALEGMVDRPGDNDRTFAVGNGGAFTPYKNGKGELVIFPNDTLNDEINCRKDNAGAITIIVRF
jgi:hypothetical protein